MNEENCDAEIWRLIPHAFDNQSAELSADDIIKRVRRNNPSALEFEDGSIKTTISRLAKKYPRFPVVSCRSDGRNGYRLRDSFDTEHPPSTKKRGRPLGSQSTTASQRHPPFDLASVYAQLKEASGGKGAVSVIKGREEIRVAINETQQRSVIVRVENNTESEIELPKRDYFVGEFSRTHGELLFQQQNDGSGDGHFTPLFAAVIGGFVSDAPQTGITPEEFIDAVERELKRIERGPNKNCLSEEEQRGLIGELWFLANVAIREAGSAEAAIKAWHGPKGSPIDFWFDGGCVEMKTSCGNKSVQISSVRQLDTPGVKKLFLAHLRLTEHSAGKGGMTLPQYVESVKKELPERILTEFDEKLANSQTDENGKGKRYRERDKRHYTDRYYVDHESLAYYRVPTENGLGESKAFPRFTQKELEDRGIEVAKYSIEIARLGEAGDPSEVIRELFSPSLPS